MPKRHSSRSNNGNSAALAELAKLWRPNQSRPNAADAIYDTLREAILKGVLHAGEPLAEIQLANVFRRSRTPVREAVLRLEVERLALRNGRRGLVVGEISREEILEVYAVREVIDGLAARWAAHSILPNELEHLVWLNDRIRDAAEREDFGTMLRLNFDFHESICRASRNSLVFVFMRQIHDWVRRFNTTTLSFPGRALEAVKDHQALLQAIEQRNPDEAERIAREHMSKARQVRVAMIQSSGAAQY